MSLPAQIAGHFRQVHFGGNWTSVDLKNILTDVTWQQATASIPGFNSIVALVYHIHYYVSTMLKVLEGGTLDAHDKYSFDHPPVNSGDDWNLLLEKVWNDAESVASLIEQLPESRFWEPFTDEKYGSYYRNFNGITEHAHYHLGQIVMLKKLLVQREAQPQRNA